MAPSLKPAMLEAALLVQAFLAGAGALRLGFANPGMTRYHGNFTSYHSLGPIIALVLLFVVLVQIKHTDATKKQNLNFEILKSLIVAALYVWSVVEGSVSNHSGLVDKLVRVFLSLAFVFVAWFSTLFVAWRRRGSGLRLES